MNSKNQLRAAAVKCLDVREILGIRAIRAILLLSSYFFRAVLPVAVLMLAMAATHATHAMNGSCARSNARSMTNTSRARVALAKACGALAMDTAFTMNVLTMSVLSMQGCTVRPARGAHDLAEVKPVVVRNLTPALPSFMRCYNVVE